MNQLNYQIQFTPEAAKQCFLIKECDYTLENKFLRILIGGKDCDGFTYQIGFDHERTDDEKIICSTESGELPVLMDKFTAFYCHNITVNYHFDPEQTEEGFSVINHNQNLYQKKFFKDESMVPPWSPNSQ
ncbi:MAG: hypothetical protein H6621_08270 [Halobacteriovoraceae bacterium]|nr:hypothetical protein [Halobacteriovoraceae bacterium]